MFKDSFFKRVENKTNIDKNTILALAQKIQNGNMKDEQTLREVIKEISSMVKTSVDSLIIKKLEVPKEEINQIQNGQGKIVEIDGKKVGIYKSEQGKIYKINPVCKHLGCELVWNNLDKTWDCPCHGSRYDYKGKLIYGPSVKDL